MTRTPSAAAASAALLLASVFTSASLTSQQAAFAKKVDDLVGKHMEAPAAVGLSVGVLWKGDLLARGYGRAEAEFDSPAKPDTMFRIGSITKQVTAAMVMRLVEQGKVDLTANSNSYVPEYDTGKHTVTVTQLLNHTSGIPSYTDIGEEWQKVWPIELTHKQLLGLVQDRPFDFQPGQDWNYNNTGYYMLGMLLENVQGKPYADLIDDLAAELQLKHTRYDSNRDLIRNRAQGYSLSNGKLSNDQLLGMNQPGGAGGLISTGADLVRWAHALHNGKVVSKESYAQMIKSTVLPSGRDTKYGFGLMPGEFADHESIGHGGGIHGFNSALHWLPEFDFYVAVISNCKLSASKVANAITFEVLGLKSPEDTQKQVDPKLKAALIGTYAVPKAGMDIRIFEKEGKLFAQGSGKGQGSFGLLYQGDGEFHASFDASVRVVFELDGSELVLHQAGMEFPGTRKQ